MNREQAIAALQRQARPSDPDPAFAIDRFRPDDALGVARLYLDAYGESFPLDYVYDPAAIAERFTGGGHTALVARSPKGEVRGVMGMFKAAPNPGLTEIGQLIILRSQRGGFMAMALFKHALDAAKAAPGTQAVFGEAVCNHTATQVMCDYFKLLPCGLEIEAMPKDAYSLEDWPGGRVSLVPVISVLADQPQAVHAPARYRDSLRETYDRLALDRTLVTDTATRPDRPSQTSLFALPHAALARLNVIAVGNDIMGRIADAESTAGPTGVTQLVLNLADPAIPDLTERLRKRGYFAAGPLPLWFETGTDGFMLQRLPGRPDFDVIRLASARNKAILEAVRRDYEAMMG